MATEFLHEPDAHRYTMLVDGELVSVAEYLDHGHGLVFNHTITIPRFRGRGYADQLVTFADRRRREERPRPGPPDLLVRRRMVRPAPGAPACWRHARSHHAVGVLGGADQCGRASRCWRRASR